MAAGQSGSDDAAMAAALKKNPRHMAPAVGRRKKRRLRAFMAQLRGGLTGTAAYRRYRARKARRR